MLKHGQIVEEGSHDELLEKQGGYYKRLWEKQSEQQAKMLAEAEDKKLAAQEMEDAFKARMIDALK